MQCATVIIVERAGRVAARMARHGSLALLSMLATTACASSAGAAAQPVPIEGCLHLIYGDPPPSGGASTARFMIDAGDGVLHAVRIGSAIVHAAGGATALDRARVRLEVVPTSRSDAPPVVRSISRLDSAGGPPC